MPHLFISAAHKSSGKTTLSLGLCAAFVNRGLTVQPFKKGPDYIDPLWLGHAAGRDCSNLDFYTMSRAEIEQTFARLDAYSDLSIIEGNKGLYDGLSLDGSNSNAALASMLGSPVILVLDARGMTRGIAPLILGYQQFASDLTIAGVILNQLGGSRHEGKLRAVIEHYTDVEVLGAVHREDALALSERHLGLIPSNEHEDASRLIAGVARVVEQQVDMDRLQTLAAGARTFAVSPTATPVTQGTDVRIGIARDAAFGFYYAADFDALQRAGAELVFFDTLTDSRLPDVDGLFIGGGFPETHLHRLAANRSLMQEIRTAAADGMPVYAECGGLMYLARSLRWRDSRVEMAGVIAADAVMHERPQGRGYVQLQQTGAGLWDIDGDDVTISAHEFHHSTLENLDPEARFAYRVLRGQGIDGKHDGICVNNVLASYTHFRDVEDNHWAQRFVGFVRRCRESADS